MINKKSMAKRAAQVGIISALTLSVVFSASADDKAYKIDVADIPLNEALIQFTIQSQWQFLSPQKLLKGKKATAVKGTMSRGEALKQLLKGTGLDYIIDDKGQVLIVPAHSKDISSINSKNRNIKVASALYVSDDSNLTYKKLLTEENNSAAETIEEEAEEYMEEVVTTGSHIRGAKSASPVFIYGREDIEKTGLSTIPQFIRTLPQVFGGGASEGNNGFSPNAGLNVNGGSSVNLRGLGTESTLILLDGRRMPGAGLGSDFVDISMIPLTALERVEVLTDGASAIYGSDAVGGVINFIMRDNYDGAETRLRYGSVTEGNSDEIQVGQVFGKAWDNGHALISYEFYQRSALDSEDRSFTKDAEDPTTLLPKQTRHSVFVKSGQNITEQVKLFGTAFYSNREIEQSQRFGSTVFLTPAQNEQYGATIGLQTTFSDSWQGELVGTYSQNDTFRLLKFFTAPFAPTNTPFLEDEDNVTSKVTALDTKADGTLFQLEGGEVKIAIGGQYRKESFNILERFIDSDRENYAIFGEAFVPFISADNRKPGLERLEITLAARYEHYSDFGSSTDPKIGLLWSPASGFNLRGTYGTSFRAPLLQELSEHNLSSLLFSIPDPDDPSQNIPGLILGGNNAKLQPETATTWTVGFDMTSNFVSGLNISLTYFNIKYKDRIKRPQAFLDGFSDPRFASFVTRNPDADFVDFWTSIPNFRNFSTFNPADTEIVFNIRLRNMSLVDTSGLDFSISYELETDLGDWNFILNSTYLFKQSTQLTETSDPFDVVDTIFNPAALKINGGLSWSRGGFATNLRVNHIGSYKDDRVTPAVDVSSWTTFDLNLSYNTENRYDSPWLKDTVFSLSIQNMFDQDPPFVKSEFNSKINFDPDNATSLGRFIAFQITRKW